MVDEVPRRVPIFSKQIAERVRGQHARPGSILPRERPIASTSLGPADSAHLGIPEEE